MKARLIIAAVDGIIGALISFLGSRQYNEVTGENQYISISEEQEIALGFQAVPELIQQFGGMESDERLQAYLDEVGEKLVRDKCRRQKQNGILNFILLDDEQTINAFALPGGPVFITMALFTQLETEGAVSGCDWVMKLDTF